MWYNSVTFKENSHMEADELVIVIPAYEPDHQLVELIDKLNSYFTGHTMVIVDDGSKEKKFIRMAANKKNVVLLTHEVNQGKGRALKTGFEYVMDLDGEQIIVTADSDGQHKPEDIYRVYNFYKKLGYGIVLGSRKFDCDIPKRSSFGNNCARFLMRSVLGIRLNDTQTGLRAFGREQLEFLTEIKGDRYEYEMTMLTQARLRGIEIHEISIETIYIDNNASSHFRPVQDFSKICSVILKYAVPALISILFFILGTLTMQALMESLKLGDLTFLVSCLSGGAFAFLVCMLLNMSGIGNGNRFLFEQPKRLVYYMLGGVLMVLAISGISYGFYVLWKLEWVALVFGILLTALILWLQMYFMAEKNQLFEE